MDFVIHLKEREPDIEDSTIQGYRSHANNMFEGIMDVPLSSLTEEILQQAIVAEMNKKNKRRSGILSPKTVRDRWALVSATLKYYMPGKSFHVKLPKKVKPEMRDLPTPKEVFDVVKGTDLELPVLLAIWLSFSLSELKGLTKSESISRNGEFITVRKTSVKLNDGYHTKDKGKTSDRVRRHRLPPYLKQLIDQVDGDVIVPMDGNTMYKKLTKMIKEAGLPHTCIHDLRHINATVMSELQIPEKIQQERGGWSTDYVMKRVYQEKLSGSRERADNKINTYFNKELNIPEN